MDNPKYACFDCYLTAHDPGYINQWSDHNDTRLTDWVCAYGTTGIDGECHEPGLPGEVCSNCEGSGTGYGLTVGGTCDLGEHNILGYWGYREYIG